jgi:predicted ABC-type ATPase
MTSKEIFEAIDLEKVGPELKTKLLTLEKATEGFTNDRVDARMDSVMNAFYNSIKDKKPEALKNIEVKEAVAEEVVVKTVNGKKKTTTRKVKRKVAGKRKKNTRKTPTPSKPLTKVTVSTIAREIRKPGETWKEALARATDVFRDRKNDQKAKSQKALAELRDFMKSDKYLKGWPRTYGKEKPDNDLERDLARKALAPGRRVSKKTGKVYYENRDNRSDREANAFPRKIYLKGGGELPKGTKYYGLNEIESITLKGGETFNYYMDSKMSPVSGIYVSPKAKIVKDEFQTELKFEKGGLNKSEFFYVPQREVESVKLDETLHDGKVIDGNFLLNGVWMQKSSRTMQLEKEIRNRMKKYELGGEVYVEPTIIQNNPDYLVGTETMYEMFELGGEVMVQPTILQNNPDYITSTTTMSELFAKGGYVDLQANLMKELQKLQRELNSPRLSRYTEGDNSQEEIARKRERASKLNRFNEILDLLRELESKKMAKGGYVAVSENNGYWYIMSTPSSKEKAQQVIDMGVPRGEVGKVVTIQEAKAYNKVIGREYLEKGGSVSSSDKAWSVKVMLDDQAVDTFMVRGRNLKEARMMVEDYHEAKMEAKYGDDIYFAIEEAMAKGGALYHRLMPGDEVLQIYKDYLIIENDDDFIYVIDFRPEIAKRIQVEEIEGENTIEAAKRVADRDFEYAKYAMGGSLYTHGLEEGDLIVEDEGAYINVLSEDGKIYYVDLGRGERSTEPPLPFENGGKVKVYNIATLSAKYGKKPEVVLQALREGADVEQEHTSDRKEAMRIAFDHLEEDFFYYPKLKAAEGGVDFEDYYEKGGQVPEQFLDSKGERKIDPKSIEELTDYVMALPQTKSIYFNEEAGEYVPSRRKLHVDIINTFKNEVVCITEGKPIAIFMGGSPASGKSSFLRKYSPYLLKEEILKVDADEIRAMLPEYEGYNAAQTHLETKDIVNTLLSDRNIGIPCDFDLIYDGTMNSVKSYIPLMDILRKRGYKIFIVYMDNVDRDVIIKRALERYQKSGRFVPLEVIEDFFEKGKTAFNQLKKDVDGYMVVDGSSQDYKIIEQGGIKLPQNREYSKLGTKINPKDIPVAYKKGGKTKKA